MFGHGYLVDGDCVPYSWWVDPRSLSSGLLNTSATILPLGVTEVSHLIAFYSPLYLRHVAMYWILIHVFPDHANNRAKPSGSPTKTPAMFSTLKKPVIMLSQRLPQMFPSFLSCLWVCLGRGARECFRCGGCCIIRCVLHRCLGHHANLIQ